MAEWGDLSLMPSLMGSLGSSPLGLAQMQQNQMARMARHEAPKPVWSPAAPYLCAQNLDEAARSGFDPAEFTEAVWSVERWCGLSESRINVLRTLADLRRVSERARVQASLPGNTSVSISASFVLPTFAGNRGRTHQASIRSIVCNHVGTLDWTVGVVVPEVPALHEMRARIRATGVWFWPWADGTIDVFPPPVEVHTFEGRFHHSSEPAIRWAHDRLYMLQGVIVPAWMVTGRRKVTVEDIDTESNIEVRRIMLERYGVEAFMRDSGAKKLGEDEFGVLWRKEFRLGRPLVMVEVVNSTPEPDGSFKHYMLRVPPDSTSPRQAVAWTFGKGRAADYAPEVQT